MRLNNSLLNESHIIDLHNHHNKKYKRELGLQKVEVFVNGKPSTILSSGDDVIFNFHVKFNGLFTNPVLGLVIKSPFGEPFIGVNNRHTGEKLDGNVKEGIIRIFIQNFSLYGSGQCGVDLYFGDNENNFDTILDAFFLELKATDAYKSGLFVNPSLNRVYQPKISFSLESV